MREMTLGQYYPIASPVHRLDARVKLLITIIYIVTLFLVKQFMVFGLIALALIGVIIASRVPFGKVIKSLKLILFLLLFTCLFHVICTTLFSW